MELRTLRFKADPVPWRDRALAAEQRVRELEEALREIADTRRHHREPKDWRLGYEIARAALREGAPVTNLDSSPE